MSKCPKFPSKDPYLLIKLKGGGGRGWPSRSPKHQPHNV